MMRSHIKIKLIDFTTFEIVAPSAFPKSNGFAIFIASPIFIPLMMPASVNIGTISSSDNCFGKKLDNNFNFASSFSIKSSRFACFAPSND